MRHGATEPREARARSDVDSIEADLTPYLQLLRKELNPADGSDIDEALCSVECFVVTALRIMRKTNPSKIRDAARTVEIKARLDGLPVIRGAA